MVEIERKHKTALEALKVVEKCAVVFKDAALSDGLNLASVASEAVDVFFADPMAPEVRSGVKRAIKSVLTGFAEMRDVLKERHSREMERLKKEIRRLKREARQKGNAVSRRVVKGIIGVAALIFAAFWAWNGEAKSATIALAFVAYICGEEIPWRSLARFFTF